MKAIDWRLAALALLLGLALGGRAAWWWQENSYGKALAEQAGNYKTEREAAASAVIDWQEVEQRKRRLLEDSLQAKDETNYKEMLNGQKAQARLRDRLATTELRLSVLLAAGTQAGSCGVSAPTSAGGVVHGAARGELDPAHAQRIVTITGDGDDGLRALQGCQEYVLSVQDGVP